MDMSLKNEIRQQDIGCSAQNEVASIVVVNGIEFEEFSEPHHIWGLVRRHEDG